MCISATMAFLSGATASAGTVAAIGAGIGAVASIRNGVMAGKDARYAASEMAQAEARSTQNANARLSQRRKALKANSLLTDGGDAASSGMAAAQRDTMGGA